MTIQAIQAQPLKPAFKAEPKAQEVAAATPANETAKPASNHKTAKVLGGVAALALLGFGIYKMVKSGSAAAPKEAASKIEESAAFKEIKTKFDEAKKFVSETLGKDKNEATFEGGKLVRTTAEDGTVTVKKLVGENDKANTAFEVVEKKLEGDKTETVFKDFMQTCEKEGKQYTDYSVRTQLEFAQVANKDGKVIEETATNHLINKAELIIKNEEGSIVGRVARDGNKITETNGEYEATLKDGKIEYKVKEKPAETPKTEKVKTEEADAPKAEETKTEEPKSEETK